MNKNTQLKEKTVKLTTDVLEEYKAFTEEEIKNVNENNNNSEKDDNKQNDKNIFKKESAIDTRRRKQRK